MEETSAIPVGSRESAQPLTGGSDSTNGSVSGGAADAIASRASIENGAQSSSTAAPGSSTPTSAVPVSFEVREARPRRASRSFGSIYSHGHSFIGSHHHAHTDDGEDEEVEDEGDMSISTASFNLANNVIGAGLVGLPYVVSSSGILPFLGFMTLSAGIATFTLHLLASCAEMAGRKNFEAVGVAALGSKGLQLTAIVVMMQCYGACIAYICLIASTAPVVGKALGIPALSGTVLQVLITVVMVLPLCLLKNLNALGSSAIFALIVYLLVAVTGVISFFTDDWHESNQESLNLCPVGEPLWFGEGITSTVKNFPTIIFAFVCHTSALPVFAELKEPTVARMRVVNTYSVLMPYVLYMAVGLLYYFTYVNTAFSSVLMNLRHCYCKEFSGEHCNSACKLQECADDNLWASILNSGFLLAVVTGYPNVHYALRKSMIALVIGPQAEFSWPVHIGIGVGNVALTLFVALVLGDGVNVVFNWAGSICSPAVCFLLPSIFYLLLCKTPEAIAKFGGMRPWSFLALAFGIVSMLVGVGLQLVDLFK
mmetsp:Transcript_67469/g.140994  ORF Transcript_67469/g.140994 Transcript_67469/m.140994 type:complete len:540 (-) Transcript_67469:120-1739(-)